MAVRHAAGGQINMRLSITFGLLAGLAVGAGSGDRPIDEYQLKAAFLFNFAKFVEWPQQSFKSPADPVNICVFGSNPFGRSLEDAVNGKSVEGRKFAVRQIADANQVSGCQMVFIPSAQRKRGAELTISGVLTVGESEGFAASGGVIGFKLEGGKIKLEINVDAAEQRKLRISSKLLSLAQIIRTQGN